MSITGSSWSSFIQASLTGKGFVGSRLSDFCDAVGNGSENHVVGKAFTTTDVGSVSGSGIGTGVGITGMDSNSVANLIFNAAMSKFGSFGSKLLDVAESLGDALVNEMANATLNSNHAPVFSGNGVIDIGSINVTDLGWGSAIESQGVGSGFLGSQWGNLAEAIGEGYAQETVNIGSGNVTISGSGGPPSGGAGNGTGIIS